ncbi:bifunctional 2-polyprenyl-6-hydroxyphenol methylase/3-demethylubiquinol 3-O-methyltransferase UbiG [Nocardioides sp. SYSU D00038]|uniref:class I SAM-dependent methyltransferase n=1 Tax=Nocardioides sp. SYSU D00038 TaxID=2812554 RepID=UPI0019675B59|nr:class I SAM-dependent methyltransferase [Nocardioides sp. SYSU D00038]
MKTDELADHLFGSALGALDILTVHLGSQLGLYGVLHQRPCTAAELAEAAGLHPRYAREWLEQQTVAGLIDVDDPALPAEERRFAVSAEHAAVLCDPDSLSFFTPFADVIAAAAVQLPALQEAFRTGGGVPWSQYGAAMRRGQAEANRPLFLHSLGSDWLPSLPDVHRALGAGGRVADLGCGDGWSSIGMGLAYPAATVDGFDVDADSVAAATATAAEYGLSDRVRFEVRDAATADPGEGYDLVTAFECVHDLPDPVGVLAAARRLVRPGGTVLVMDERVPAEFTGRSGDAVEQLMYGMSVLICLPDGLSHHPSVGTGTVMRPDTLAAYAGDAGFSGVEVLPIEHEMFRFYRLVA